MKKNYSNEYKFQNIFGKQYEIQEDIFITRYAGSKNIKLQPFRKLFGNSDGYEEYLKNPEQWYQSHVKIYGVINKGEKFTVGSVLGYTHIETGKRYRVVPIFRKRKFDSDVIDASWLFERNLDRGSNKYYYLVDESLLREIEE